MKKIIKNLAVIAIALFGFAVIGVNVVSVSYGNPYENIMEDPGNGGGGGGEDCNLCVVTNIWGKTIFSCRPEQGVNNCEDSGGGYTVFCANAEEC